MGGREEQCAIGCASCARFYSLSLFHLCAGQTRPADPDPSVTRGAELRWMDVNVLRAHAMHLVCVCVCVCVRERDGTN